jgi:hypothetical protein
VTGIHNGGEPTVGQAQILLAQHIAPESTWHNVPLYVTITGPADVAALRRALALVTRRHIAVRTLFDADFVANALSGQCPRGHRTSHSAPSRRAHVTASAFAASALPSQRLHGHSASHSAPSRPAHLAASALVQLHGLLVNRNDKPDSRVACDPMVEQTYRPRRHADRAARDDTPVSGAPRFQSIRSW